jgi:ribosomal protein S14
MLSAKIKDIKIRKKVYDSELNKNSIKFLFINILNNKTLNTKLKIKIRFILSKMLNKSMSKTKITRRCSFNNRNRVSDRKLGISRILLKDMLKAGIIPGYKKAIW